MIRRTALWTMIGLWAALAPAAAWAQHRQPAVGGQPAARPQYPPASKQALMPRDPTLHRRTAPEQAPAAPFTLTPQQQAQVEWVLQRWEQHGAGVKAFETRFTRFDWDQVFGPANQPKHIFIGEIRYAAPDKGMFRVTHELVGFRWQSGQAVDAKRVEAQQPEHWVCDGKSIFQFDYAKRQLIEYRLPPEAQGSAIADTPLPFLFAAKADQLKQRYFLRVLPGSSQEQVWLEAHPRFRADAANFRQATLILNLSDMQPFALEQVLPNGKSRTVYRFDKPKVNPRSPLDPLGIFEANWANVQTPFGWKRTVEQAPAAEARHRPTAPSMR